MVLRKIICFIQKYFLLDTLPQSPSVCWYIGFPLDLVSLLSPVFSPTLAHSLSPSAKPPRLDGFVKRISFDL